ncbi:MAG TPA: hypothetical protein VN821_16710 [Candidatus Udaeobacter sp.]|nr:hypothetical protein [Candidatus Udaeobacter sp.]
MMSKLVKFSCVAIAICVLAWAFDAAFALTDLANTTWSSSADTGCGIDISFNSGGTATVMKTQVMATHRDTAHWTMEGSELHLTYDNWQGGIEGSFWEGGSELGINVEAIHATETYQDDSGATRARACIFEQNK